MTEVRDHHSVSINIEDQENAAQVEKIEKLKADIRQELHNIDNSAYNQDADICQKRQVLENILKSLEGHQADTKNLETNIAALRNTNNDLKDSIEKLNSEKKLLEEEIEANNAKISELDSIIQKQRVENQTLEEENQKKDQKIADLEDENKKLEVNLNNLITEIQRLVNENDASEKSRDAIKKDIQEINSKIAEKEAEVKKLSAEIEEAKKYVYSKKVNEDVPYTSIQTTTNYALAKNGWPVNANSEDTVKALQQEKIPIVGIVGGTCSGKSFVANKISDDKLPVGPDIESDRRNNIIDIHYIQRDGKWAGILSSTGYDEPLQANRKNMYENLPIASPEESKSDESALLNLRRFELLYDDLIITEAIKFDFIIKNVSLIILVVNSLKGSDLERLFKIKELISSVEEERRPEVLVVHNLHQLINVEHVLEEIKFSIQKTFQPIKSSDKKSWTDQFGFVHLIMAADGSKAGKDYNPETIKLIQTKLFNIENTKREFRFVESFMTACSETLSDILEPNKIALDYDTQSKCINDPQKTLIKPLQLRCHGCYNAFAREGFKPAFSIAKKVLSNGSQEFYIDLELLDGKIDKRVVKRLKGSDCLLIWGERKSYEGYDQDEDAPIENSDGNFVLNIPLRPQAAGEHKILPDEDRGSGIKRLTVQFFNTE